MTVARACWLTLVLGCASQPSPPSPSDVLDGLMKDASSCGGVSTVLGDSQTAQREAQPVVDCLNAALAAKTVAFTGALRSTRDGCNDSWWFVTDKERVRLFHTDFPDDECVGDPVIEDPGCDGPFFVDDTPLAFWAIQATGCTVVVPQGVSG